MPQLHLTRASYDLFVYDYRYDFFRNRRWNKVTTYVLTFVMITLRVLLATDQESPLRDLVEIVWKAHSHLHCFRTKTYDASSMSLLDPYDYHKSLRSLFLHKGLSKSLRCLTISMCAHTGSMRSTCDVSMGCGLAFFFQILSLCGFKQNSTGFHSPESM